MLDNQTSTLVSVAGMSREEMLAKLSEHETSPIVADGEVKPETRISAVPAAGSPAMAFQAGDQFTSDLFDPRAGYDGLPDDLKGRHLWAWNAQMRVLPVEIAISALFGIGNNKVDRRPYQREKITILSREFEMRYTGLELRQDDELVWMQLLHIGRGNDVPLGAPLYFKAAAFLKALGKTLGQDNYRHLKESMARLQATTIELYSHSRKVTTTFRLVCHFEYEDEGHFPLPAWKVVLDPRLFALLDSRYHMRINFERRKRIGNGLASKLHSYYACHREPMDRSVDDLFTLCYQDVGQLQASFLKSRRLSRGKEENQQQARAYVAQKKRDFRRDLREALDRLTLPEIGFLATYRLYQRDDLSKTWMVHVERVKEPGYNVGMDEATSCAGVGGVGIN
jgi:hypothetical protein